jgi:hypothetical protein
MEQSVIQMIDRPGILSEINVECISCPIHLMIEQGIRGPGRGDYYCHKIKKDCVWRTHSRRGNGELNFAPSAAVFNKYGFKLVNDKSTYKIGKCHFLFFLFHPDSNWEPPKERPNGILRNRFGKIVQPSDRWELCHNNGLFWDDSKRNLEWRWRSEHKVLEPNTKSDKEPITIYEAGIPK